MDKKHIHVSLVFLKKANNHSQTVMTHKES